MAEGQQRLARDLRTIVDDAEALLKHAVRDAGGEYASARERLESSMHAARERLVALEKSALDGIGEAGRAADTYVREHPWSAIGAGAGVGLLVGLLLGRR
jgi:ElaB/YqjD/DUF883 family membrane-anchored ribosome-binding protein